MVLDKMHARAKVSEDRISVLFVLNTMRLRIPNFVLPVVEYPRA